MSESSVKRRKRYLVYPKGESKTCLINSPWNSSDEWKVLGDFGYTYINTRPTKDHGNNPAPRNKFNRQQENNAIVNSAVDKILLQENEKVSSVREAHENIESDFDEIKIYQIDNISIEDTKEKIE